MSEEFQGQIADFKSILETQRRLGRRFLWLQIMPLLITVVVVVMFYYTSMRLADVEIGTKLVTVERFILSDKNYPWAVKQYEEISRTKDNAPILARLGMLYFLVDKTNSETAIKTLERAKQIDPGNWEIYRNLTFIYQQIGRTQDSIAAARKALELNPQDANTYNNLAWLHSMSNEVGVRDLRQAQQFAERAVDLTQGSQVDFLDTLAGVYAEQKDMERALATFRKAKDVAQRDIKALQAHFDRYFPGQPL